jgi:hypothetical protein
LGWLVDVLPPVRVQQTAAFVTTRAYQFRLDAVGRVGPRSTREAGDTTVTPRAAGVPPPPARVMRRILAIFDRGASTPRLLYVRDASRLGMAYAITEPD